MGLIIITLYYNFSSGLQSYYLQLKNQYTKNNEYLAGGISPGIKLRFDSINQGTFLIKKIKPNYPKDLKAYDTESSVNIGTLIGVQLEIEGFIKKYSSQYANLKVIITGGFSGLFKNSIKTKVSQNLNITIKGLIKILRLIK